MISISARGSAAEAVRYYEHLAGDYGPSDYYSRESAGHFTGAGLAALGIEEGTATNVEMFKALAEGRHPLTGEALVQNAGEDHRSGWDVTLSPPKSVSTIWGLADADTRAAIESAHQAAVREAREYLENHAAYTRRGGGWQSEAERREQIDGFVIANYQHGTSREADPHLHTHMMVYNLAHRADGTWGSLNPREIYQHQSAAGAIYSAALAGELQRRGYAIERVDREFEVVGVPQELRDEFSTRRQQIEAELAERGASGSRASERATLATRRAKEARDIDGLREQWAERARERAPDWSPEQALGQEQPPLDPVPPHAEILRSLTEQRSTFAAQDVTAAVGIAAIGTLTPEQIESRAREVLADAEVVRLEGRDGLPRYTTHEILALERGIVERAERMSRSETHAVEADTVAAALESRPTLSDEQREAVVHVTAAGSVAAVQGSAGSGKSYALGAAREIWEASGYRVRGAALSGKAAAELQAGSGIEGTTLHQLIADTAPETVRGVEYAARDPLRAGDVIVIDEAGMVGSRQLSELMRRADEAGAKVVLVGDTRQLQAIEAGAPFRTILERTGGVSIDDIRRQNHEADRQAVRDLRDGRAAEALKNLAGRDRVHEYKSAAAAIEAAGKSVAADLADGKSSVAVVATKAEARLLNEAARAEAVERGLVQREAVSVETERGARDLAAGDRVVLLRNDRDLAVKNGDFGTVVAIERTGDEAARVTLRLDRDGTERVISTDKYDHIDHGYAATAHKLQGATVERAHILASDSPLSSREWAYVAGSRHREEVHVHGERHAIHDLAPDWSKSRQKDASVDYQVAAGREQSAERQAPDREVAVREDPAAQREPDRREARQERGQEREAPRDYVVAREASEVLRDYQRAADLRREAAWMEHAAGREPDRDRAEYMRRRADGLRADADGIRARAESREKSLPREYRRDVREADHRARGYERRADKLRSRADEHYRDAGRALARAQDPRTGLISAVGSAIDYRESRWRAERAERMAREMQSDARESRRSGQDAAWDRARAADATRRAERAAERAQEREAAARMRDAARERGADRGGPELERTL